MFIVAILISVLDQLTKALALKKLEPGVSIPLIKNIFHLTLVGNTGSAFGLFKNSTIIFIVVTLIAVIVILRYLFTKRVDTLARFSLFLILGGATGNLIDRLRFGYVVDFLDFRIWPVFNIADSAITIGAVLIGYSILRKPKIKKQR